MNENMKNNLITHGNPSADFPISFEFFLSEKRTQQAINGCGYASTQIELCPTSLIARLEKNNFMFFVYYNYELRN